MEERSLRIYDSEKTFFSKITNTINKFYTNKNWNKWYANINKKK